MKKIRLPLSLPWPRYPGGDLPPEVVRFGVWMGSKIELQEVGLWLDVGWVYRNRHGFLSCAGPQNVGFPHTLLSGNTSSDETWGRLGLGVLPDFRPRFFLIGMTAKAYLKKGRWILVVNQGYTPEQVCKYSAIPYP